MRGLAHIARVGSVLKISCTIIKLVPKYDVLLPKICLPKISSVESISRQTYPSSPYSDVRHVKYYSKQRTPEATRLLIQMYYLSTIIGVCKRFKQEFGIH